MTSARIEIGGELLRWARERSGLKPEELAGKFPKLKAWERGTAHPTLRQVEAFAQATSVPIGLLFLPQPPQEPPPVPDLRSGRGGEPVRMSGRLLETIYLCQQRQEWYREYVRASGEEGFAGVGSAKVEDEVVAAAAKIRAAIGLDTEQRRRLPTWSDALRQMIDLTDQAGIMVMVSGVVGSNNKRKLDPAEFRGFALVDPLAPLVFINGADTKASQMFTLAHEMAHIWLGESGVSDSIAPRSPVHPLEKWCNRVAAELLVPLAEFRQDYNRHAPLHAEMARLAARFKVSTIVVLRRMHDAGGLSADRVWEEYEREVRRLAGIPRSSGGNFYLTLAARASRRFARGLVSSTLEGRTSFSEAFRLLGFKKMATFNKVGESLGVLPRGLPA